MKVKDVFKELEGHFHKCYIEEHSNLILKTISLTNKKPSKKRTNTEESD